MSDAFFVLAVGDRGTPKCARQIVYRGKRRLSQVDAPGQPRRDLLQQTTGSRPGR
jgi:hypothetical protein